MGTVLLYTAGVEDELVGERTFGFWLMYTCDDYTSKRALSRSVFCITHRDLYIRREKRKQANDRLLL